MSVFVIFVVAEKEHMKGDNSMSLLAEHILFIEKVVELFGGGSVILFKKKKTYQYILLYFNNKNSEQTCVLSLVNCL